MSSVSIALDVCAADSKAKTLEEGKAFYQVLSESRKLYYKLHEKNAVLEEVIDQIQEAMNHTKMNGDINWQDGDDIDVCLAGTFAADRFIVIHNRTKSSTSKHNFIK